MQNFIDLIDLASARLGGAVIGANDEFFAPKEALLKTSAPEWREGEYTERGKWMDGWETRRRRSPGYDWAMVRLGAAGIVRGVVVDTSFFTGNYPERASIEAASVDGITTLDALTNGDVKWDLLLPASALKGNTRNEFEVSRVKRVTHVRLNIFPDGGVARLRVHGDVMADERIFDSRREVDLAAMENGGYVVECSDMHYGHRQNLIMPGHSTHMGDGWETKRRRGPGNDWTIVRLGRRGVISRVELETDHFKGNAPASVMLEVADVDRGFDAASAAWKTILPNSPSEPHTRHHFEVKDQMQATHVRLNIYPDGGVARLRLFGTVV